VAKRKTAPRIEAERRFIGPPLIGPN